MIISSNRLREKYLDERFGRVDDRIDALKELIEQRATAADRALEVAKTGLNEMRGMAMDQQTAFLTRSEYNAKHDSIMSQMQNNSEKVTALIGRGSGADKTWYVVATAISILIAIVMSVAAVHRW